MEGSQELESSLLTQPWASVCLGESTFLAKACFRDTGYILLISDLSSVWYENVDAEAVEQRSKRGCAGHVVTGGVDMLSEPLRELSYNDCWPATLIVACRACVLVQTLAPCPLLGPCWASKELNKRLTVHVSSFLHHLHNLMCPFLAGQPDTATSFSCHRAVGSLSLRVKSELSGLPFYWNFHCCPAPVEMVSCHLVQPLIQMSLVLQYQVQKLTSLLLEKDAEIEDYQESGAVLSRDRLRTEPFQEEKFKQNFMTESLPQICCVGEGQAFASALQQLYVAVMQQKAKQARKRQYLEDSEDLAPTAETTEHPHLPPPSQEAETASSREGTTPTSSPSQKPRLPVAKAKPKKAKGLFS